MSFSENTNKQFDAVNEVSECMSVLKQGSSAWARVHSESDKLSWNAEHAPSIVYSTFS